MSKRCALFYCRLSGAGPGGRDQSSVGTVSIKRPPPRLSRSFSPDRCLLSGVCPLFASFCADCRLSVPGQSTWKHCAVLGVNNAPSGIRVTPSGRGKSVWPRRKLTPEHLDFPYLLLEWLRPRKPLLRRIGWSNGVAPSNISKDTRLL